MAHEARGAMARGTGDPAATETVAVLPRGEVLRSVVVMR